MEPTIKGPWQGHYRCDQCGRVIDGQTGVVLRRVLVLGYDDATGLAKVERRQEDRRIRPFVPMMEGRERRRGGRRGDE